MPIVAVPKDLEVRKLTAAQAKSIETYLKKTGDQSVTKAALLVGIPAAAFLTVAGGTAFLAWHYLKDKELPSVNDIAKLFGGGIADIITDGINKVFSFNPTTPATFVDAQGIVRTLTRCQRWEVDAVDIKAKVQAGNLSKREIGTLATTLLLIVKNMKSEGCERPTAISETQWAQG